MVFRKNNSSINKGVIEVVSLRASSDDTTRGNVSWAIFSVVFPCAQPAKVAYRVSDKKMYPKAVTDPYFVDHCAYHFMNRVQVRNDARVSVLEGRHTTRYVNDAVVLVRSMSA